MKWLGWNNTGMKTDDGYRWHCGCETLRVKRQQADPRDKKRDQRYSVHNANTYRWMAMKRSNNKESFCISQRRFWRSRKFEFEFDADKTLTHFILIKQVK